MSQQMTKTQCEVIATAIKSEARAMMENLRGYKITDPARAERECALSGRLQTLWSLTLSMGTHLQRFPGFDRDKFIEACGTSPQNWRYMNWYETPTGIGYYNDSEAQEKGFALRGN